MHHHSESPRFLDPLHRGNPSMKSVADCEQGLLLSQGREFKRNGRIVLITITDSLHLVSYSSREYMLTFPQFISSIERDWVMKPGKARNWHKRVTSP